MFDALLRICFWLALLFVSYNAFAPPDLMAAPALSDIVLHVSAFVVLTGLALAAYPRWPQWVSPLGLLLYGAAIEIVQAQLPSRSAEWKDFAVDLLGIAAGIACYRLFGQRWVQRARARWQKPAG